MWREGAREWFLLLKIREVLLEEMFKVSLRGSTGANKTQDDVGKAFLAKGTAQRNEDQQHGGGVDTQYRWLRFLEGVGS